MAGERKARPGRKVSTYFSGDQLDEMEARGLTPAEIVRRGFAYQKPVELPVDLQGAMEYLLALAQALASGGRVSYPDQPGQPG